MATTSGTHGSGGDRYAGLDVSDLRVLVESAGVLAAELELTGLLDRILEQASQMTDSPDAAILLYEPRRDALFFAAASGVNAPALLQRWGVDSELGVPIAGSKAGEVFTTGEARMEETLSDDADHFKGVDDDVDHTTRSMVCVPLSAAGNRLGVVQLLNKRTGAYGARDLVLLEQFSAQAAVAIRNLQLFEQLLAHMGLYGSRRAGVGPAELLAELNAPPRSEQVSVLLADMRGSTTLTQVVDRPEQAFAYLNQFMAMLAIAVLDNGGLVNKFLGDGLMAIFRGTDTGTRAVRCAFDITAGFDELKAGWDASSNTSLHFLDVGVGITTDRVLLGSIGTDRVRDFTVIGVPVALAACLTDHARGGRRILTDKLTFREAGDLVSKQEGPITIELRSPGQSAGRSFESYSIEMARGDASTVEAATTAPSSPAIFVSYSHRDAAWLARLRTHLKPYVRAGAITIWDDAGIRPGHEWRAEIEAALAGSKMAILLVSPDFLDSDFIAESELPPLLEAARRDGKKILWIPLSASSYDQTEIGRYQALSDPAAPLDALDTADQNRELVAIAKKIADALEE